MIQELGMFTIHLLKMFAHVCKTINFARLIL